MSEMNGNDEKSGHGAPPNSPRTEQVNPSNEPTEDPKEKPDKTVPEAEAHDSTGDIPICLDVVKEPTPPSTEQVDPPNDPKEEPDKAVPEAEDPPPGPSNGDGDDMCCNIFMDEILEQHQSK
ncbi:hypothetical protein N658DRAFT_488947 [Parathielavia hyrcaniae]|uniref:Uncharacterized protein n=1 Tax=Parathielavia hyrcaniae TaxID=113614 RepID=A0AAN6PU20_9PEZI|nr:hypothetical protein N658DRAFT_488947 [Parathielavia hyrcaniae]